MEQMVRAFNFLFTFFINELSLRDSGNGAFVLKTAYQPQFVEFHHPRLQNVSRVPHPTEIASLMAKQYPPGTSTSEGHNARLDFRPRVVAYSDATAFAHASNYDEVARIEDALDKMFRESEEEDAAMLSSLSQIQAGDFIRIDGRPRHASGGPPGGGSIAGQRDRQARFHAAGPNFSSSLSSNVPSPAPNGQVPSPAPPDQNIMTSTTTTSAAGMTTSYHPHQHQLHTAGTASGSAGLDLGTTGPAAGPGTAAAAGIGGGSTNSNTSHHHTTSSNYPGAPPVQQGGVPLRSTALSTIPEHHTEPPGVMGPNLGSGPGPPDPGGRLNNNRISSTNINNGNIPNTSGNANIDTQMMNRQNQLHHPRAPGLSALKARSGSDSSNNKPVITSSGGGYPPDLLVHSNWQEHSFDSSVVTEGHYDASFESEVPPMGASIDEPPVTSQQQPVTSTAATSSSTISKARAPPIAQTSKKSVFSLSAGNNPPPGGPGPGTTSASTGPSGAPNTQGGPGGASGLMLWKKVQHYVVVGGAFVQGAANAENAGGEAGVAPAVTSSATSNNARTASVVGQPSLTATAASKPPAAVT